MNIPSGTRTRSEVHGYGQNEFVPCSSAPSPDIREIAKLSFSEFLDELFLEGNIIFRHEAHVLRTQCINQPHKVTEGKGIRNPFAAAFNKYAYEERTTARCGHHILLFAPSVEPGYRRGCAGRTHTSPVESIIGHSTPVGHVAQDPSGPVSALNARQTHTRIARYPHHVDSSATVNNGVTACL